MADEQTFEQLATDKEKLFVEFYVLCMNRSEAARRAGYEASRARQTGYDLVTKSYIRDEIDRRLQARVMNATDVLARWSAIADTDISPYLKIYRGKIAVDVERLKADGLGYLIKSVKNTKFGQTIEFRDPDAALEKLGKVHKLLVDRHELTGKDGEPIKTYVSISPDDWDDDKS